MGAYCSPFGRSRVTPCSVVALGKCLHFVSFTCLICKSRTLIVVTTHKTVVSIKGNSREAPRITGSLFLSPGIFLIQGSNPGLLHCRQILYHLSCQGSPVKFTAYSIKALYTVDIIIRMGLWTSLSLPWPSYSPIRNTKCSSSFMSGSNLLLPSALSAWFPA